jgi:hypothetical protein
MRIRRRTELDWMERGKPRLKKENLVRAAAGKVLGLQEEGTTSLETEEDIGMVGKNVLRDNKNQGFFLPKMFLKSHILKNIKNLTSSSSLC